MSIPDSIKTDFLFTTVRIEAVYENDTEGTGTGFLFEYHHKKESYVFLITNKHVIRNAQKGFLQFNLCEGEDVFLGAFHSLTYYQCFKPLSQWLKYP